MSKTILIVGGGAAGLMAAETCLEGGADVVLVEKMPSIGRKILMAGKSGLNLTFDQTDNDFAAAYDRNEMRLIVSSFPPSSVRNWADALGADTFVGSAGKVFPRVMKASPLLRNWLSRLQAMGLDMRTRHKYVGQAPDELRFETPKGNAIIEADQIIYALGGASWPRLGTDGAWASAFPTTEFVASNVGFDCDWSPHMTPYAGQWLKNIGLLSNHRSRGEIIISRTGIEGGGLYPHSSAIIDGAPLKIDLLPHHSQEHVATQWQALGKASVATKLRKLGLGDAARAIYFECVKRDPHSTIKSLKIPIARSRPIAEAISTRGGVTWGALDGRLALKDYPRIFCAGEMVDWDAPTGGYLLSGCFAMGRWAGQSALAS